MPLSTGPSIENRVLSALPMAELERLRTHLQPVVLRQKQILHQAGEAAEQVYFVEQALASVLTVMADGAAVEVRMVGREGVSDLSCVLGGKVSPYQVIVQVSGTALRISAALLRAEFDAREALRDIVLRCISSGLAMTSQSAACNRLHSLEQRRARWLLNASDRIGVVAMPMTHEFLSSLLGVRRPGGDCNGQSPSALWADPLLARQLEDHRSRSNGSLRLRVLPRRSRAVSVEPRNRPELSAKKLTPVCGYRRAAVYDRIAKSSRNLLAYCHLLPAGVANKAASASAASPLCKEQRMPLSSSTIENRVLGALPPVEVEHLSPQLQQVTLPLRQILHEVGAAIEHVYFIEKGLASVLTTMADGSAIEVRMLGREGIVGLHYLLGAEASNQQVIVQVPGVAWRMNAALFKAEFDRRETLRRVVLRLVSAALAMTSQNAACNRLHTVEQRFARWLLEASNRIRSDTMPMTHEFLSSLLGVRRAGVTAAAAEMQRSGLIRYHRGQLAIADREALEARACECYFVDHEQFEWEQAPRRKDPRA